MPESKLSAPDFSTWFGAPMVQDPNDPAIFRAEPSEGIYLVETLYVQNPRAQGKRRGEDWSATIRLHLPIDDLLDQGVQGVGFESNRAEARASAVVKLKEQLEPLIQKLGFLGLLPLGLLKNEDS